MQVGTFQLSVLPPRGATIRVALAPREVHGAVLWDLTAYQSEGAGDAALWVPWLQASSLGDPSVAAHLFAAFVARAGLVVLSQEPAPGTVINAPDAKGTPTPWITIPALVELAGAPLPPDGPRLGQLVQQLQVMLQGGALHAAGAGKPVPPELVDRLPKGLLVGPSTDGEYRMACGAQMTGEGWSLGGACIAGGPCKHTSSGRCWRWRAGADGGATGGAEEEKDVVAPEPTPLAEKVVSIKKKPSARTRPAKKPATAPAKD